MSDFRTLSIQARARADSFRWLAEREPARRTLTQEECHILAREAEQFAIGFDRAFDHAATEEAKTK